MNAEHRNAVPANTAISRSWLRAFSDMPTTPQARTEFGRQEAPTPPSWASSFGIRIMLSTIQAVSSISIAHRTALQHHVVWESAVTNVLMVLAGESWLRLWEPNRSRQHRSQYQIENRPAFV